MDFCGVIVEAGKCLKHEDAQPDLGMGKFDKHQSSTNPKEDHHVLDAGKGSSNDKVESSKKRSEGFAEKATVSAKKARLVTPPKTEMLDTSDDSDDEYTWDECDDEKRPEDEYDSDPDRQDELTSTEEIEYIDFRDVYKSRVITPSMLNKVRRYENGK